MICRDHESDGDYVPVPRPTFNLAAAGTVAVAGVGARSVVEEPAGSLERFVPIEGVALVVGRAVIDARLDVVVALQSLVVSVLSVARAAVADRLCEAGGVHQLKCGAVGHYISSCRVGIFLSEPRRSGSTRLVRQNIFRGCRHSLDLR